MGNEGDAGTKSSSGPQRRSRAGAKIGEASTQGCAVRWDRSSRVVVMAKSGEPMAASYFPRTQRRRAADRAPLGPGAAAARARALFFMLSAEHSKSNSESIAVPTAMLVHGSNAAPRSCPNAIIQPRRHLEKAEERPSALRENVARARDGLGRALGRGRRVDLRPVDRAIQHEVGIALARGCGDRAHEIVVGEIEAAGEDGGQYVHSGVTLPRTSLAAMGPNVRESKLLA